MLRKILTSCVAMSIFYFAVAQTNKLEVINPDSTTSGTATAEESKPKTVISGSVDVYYKYVFKKQAGNNKTSFTNSHNSFELGMASVKVEHTIGKVGMVARSEEHTSELQSRQYI